MPQKQTGKVAGLDLGRVEPFVLSVLSPKKRVAATFFASPGLKQANAKRERLIKESNRIWVKEQQYIKLGLEDKAQVLKTERSFKRSKIKRLAAHIARKAGSETSRILAEYEVPILHLENLSWVGSRGGKWNHAQQQEHHQHAGARKGVKTRFVNPKNTSQYCWDCKKPIVHNVKQRSVFCQNCKTTLPRDVNAANAIAKNINKTYPGAKRAIGDNRSSSILGQVVQPLTVDESRRKNTLLSDNTPYLTKSTT